MISPSYGLTATERVLPRLALDFTTATLDPRVTLTRSGNTATRINASTNLVHIGVGPTAAAAQANAVAATAGNPAAGIPLVGGAVEVLRFPLGSYFSGVAGAANTVYITPGTGL